MKKGIPASPGIASGKVWIFQKEKPVIPKRMIKEDEVSLELERFHQAIDKAKEHLSDVAKLVSENVGEDMGEIFQAHRMILEDYLLIGAIEASISSERNNAEVAVEQNIHRFAGMFEMANDDYTRERANDLRDLGMRVIRNLLGYQGCDLSKMPEDVILFAEDLTPSDTSLIDKSKLLGFVTEVGGRTSHTAILARALEIPAVVGMGEGFTKRASNHQVAIIDGNQGDVMLDPPRALSEDYEGRKVRYSLYKQELGLLRDKPATTADGIRINLRGNIATPNDLSRVFNYGGEGVGLFRTEFLFINRQKPPTEEEQFRAYKEVIKGVGNFPVTVRTLDMGGDKSCPYLQLGPEANPFLGFRALRLCLAKEDLFIDQLKAIYRAAVHGKVKIILPMISSLEELWAAKDIIQKAIKFLERDRVIFNNDIPLGVMIEIPAAAIIADLLVAEVDFLSIGTNDLTQYSLAVDRMNPNVSHFYEPLSPSLLRMMDLVVSAGKAAGKEVTMCGELAGEPEAIPLLLGLGIKELSMNAPAIPLVKDVIRRLDWPLIEGITKEVKGYNRIEDIHKHLNKIMKDIKALDYS